MKYVWRSPRDTASCGRQRPAAEERKREQSMGHVLARRPASTAAHPRPPLRLVFRDHFARVLRDEISPRNVSVSKDPEASPRSLLDCDCRKLLPLETLIRAGVARRAVARRAFRQQDTIEAVVADPWRWGGTRRAAR